MKKLILIAVVALGLISCYRTQNTVTKTTELPNVVYQAVNDTTQKPKYILVETDDNVYLVNKTAPKNEAVESYYEKEVPIGLFIFLVVLLVIVILGLFGAFAE